mmetsp:Transcript_18733/g.27066  ORF Transcript_18733/g.27066 Transcript_18733/m.27066 type:complete len:365 (+) Transcript_18733:588-1682(+)
MRFTSVGKTLIMVLFFHPAQQSVEAQNDGLRGMSMTKVEDEYPDLRMLLSMPYPFLGEGAETPPDNEDSEDSGRSRSRHGGHNSSEYGQISAEERIINGVSAANEFNYFALMIHKRETGQSRVCGGTLIEEEWILTAKHCNMKGGDWAWIGAFDASPSKREQAYFDTCFDHPKFNWPQYDYTLCRLKKPSYMPRVRIAEANYEPNQSEELTVIGMGKTEKGGVTNNLLKAKVEYQRKEDCSGKFGLGPFQADSMLCAGGGDTDACKGDSGGPILYNDNGEFVQIGVVSWGRGCGSGNPGVYADVRTERKWIDATICNNSVNSVASRCSPQTTTATPTGVPTKAPTPRPTNTRQTCPTTCKCACN